MYACVPHRDSSQVTAQQLAITPDLRPTYMKHGEPA